MTDPPVKIRDYSSPEVAGWKGQEERKIEKRAVNGSKEKKVNDFYDLRIDRSG